MQETLSELLKNSIPYKLLQQEEQVLCQWLKIDEKNFTDPFFEETISGYLEDKANSSRFRCVSNLAILPEWAAQLECIEPTAFIFHVSRCGSTLLSQLLSLFDENIVLSEVPFFDTLLRDTTLIPQGIDRTELLQAAIRIYGSKRQARHSRVFIKTDSWHVLFYSQLRMMYPTVPFILLYRHPAEVIRSQQKRKGMQAVPGVIEPSLFGFTQEEITGLSLDEYMIKVLEVYFSCFIDIANRDPLAFPVNYNQGAMAIMKKMAAITSTPMDQKFIDEIIKRSQYHAKYPDTAFQEEEHFADMPSFGSNVVELYQSLETISLSHRVKFQDEPVQSFG